MRETLAPPKAPLARRMSAVDREGKWRTARPQPFPPCSDFARLVGVEWQTDDNKQSKGSRASVLDVWFPLRDDGKGEAGEPCAQMLKR